VIRVLPGCCGALHAVWRLEGRKFIEVDHPDCRIPDASPIDRWYSRCMIQYLEVRFLLIPLPAITDGLSR
jgi:hypothetical protein